MLQLNFSNNADYKELLFTTLKGKFNFFITGLLVIGVSFAWTIYHFYPGVIFNTTKTVKALTQVYNNPNLMPKNTLDINKVMKSYGGGSLMQATPTPTMNKKTENGQISAIKSEKVTNTNSTYTIKQGDSLASVALEVYGDPQGWVTIAQANNLSSPDLIEVGMVLKIPRK